MKTIFFYASNEELEKVSKESDIIAEFCETHMNDGESEDTDETDAEGNIRFKFTVDVDDATCILVMDALTEAGIQSGVCQLRDFLTQS